MGGISGFDDKGQPLAVGDAAEADALFDSGKLKFARGQSVKVRSSDGRIFDLPAENYELARKAGASLVTDDEARTERKAEEIRDAGALAAFGRGAASTVVDPMLAIGANLGVTKDFRDISRDALKNQATDLEASEKEFAGATTGGKLFGYVAPTLLTAGANLGVRAGAQVTAKGLAAATAQRATVAGVSNVAGETAAQLAVKGMAKLGAGKVATNVAKWGAQGAAEGVVQGASDAMVQATLDNPDKVAESMLASVGPSALYGAAGNVILGGIGKGIARGATASKDAIKGLAYRATRGAAQELGEVNPVVLDAAERKAAEYLGAAKEEPGFAARVVGGITGADAGDVQSSMSAKAAHAIDNPERFIEDSNEEFVKRLRKIKDATVDIDEATSRSGAQYDSLRKLAADADPKTVRSFSMRHAGEVIDRLRALGESPEADSLAGFKKLRAKLDHAAENGYVKRIENAWNSDNGTGETFVALDQFKTDIQSMAAIRPGRNASPELRRAWDELKEISEFQRSDLANSGHAFGEAPARWYSEKNAGYTEELSWKDKFSRTFLDRPEQEEFDFKRDFDPKKTKGHIEISGEFEGSNESRALTQDMNGKRTRLAAIVNEPGFDEATRAKAAEAIEAIDDFQAFYSDLAQVNMSRRDAGKVAAQAQRRLAGTEVLGAAVGFAVAGPWGAAGGAGLARAIGRPDRIANALASARTMIGKRSGAILGAAGGVSNRARGIFEKAGKVAPRAGRALAGGALFLAYKDKVREIVDATTNTATVPELDAITPGLSGALAAKRATALDFLKSKAPTGALGGGGMFAHLETPAVTEYQARRFFEYVRGVEDPLAVLEEVRSGAVSQEAIEAVRAVYPETFAEMQQVVTEQLAGLKEPPPYESRLELYRVFGVASDRSLSPEFFASIQALPGIAPTEAPQQRPAGAAKDGLGQLALSDTARMQSR